TLRDLHGLARRRPITLRIAAGALTDARDVIAVRMERLDLLGRGAVETRAPRLLLDELGRETRDVLLECVEVAFELPVVGALVEASHPLVRASPCPRLVDVGEANRPGQAQRILGEGLSECGCRGGQARVEGDEFQLLTLLPCRPVPRVQSRVDRVGIGAVEGTGQRW